MRDITPKSQDISKWYTDVILKAELADYSPVKGSMVIRPYGFALWESIQKFMDALIKKRGVKNAYFPLFIPESYLHKEKEHVEGFSPQVAVVTYAGGEELKEKLIIRPTSETIMYEMYKQWIHSWRDLPVLINQWNNVVRWEKRTYLFLRTSEFLWQEGHCAHATREENLKTVMWALKVYQKTYKDLMAVYGIIGVKSSSEKFAGAAKTFSFEALMPDGKALQAATSHDLGQNFSKVFDIQFQNAQGKQDFVWQTSWGLSTRSLGGLFLTHGDDDGLILPPKIAPYQIVIIVIPSPRGAENVLADVRKMAAYIQNLQKDLTKKGIRVKVDTSEEIEIYLQDLQADTSVESVGRRFNKWEVKGVPMRLEIGSKEVVGGIVTVAIRDTKDKVIMKLDEFIATVDTLLSDIQKRLFEKQKKFLQDNTHDVSSWGEFVKIMNSTRGFLHAFWCEDPACEKQIKEKTKATTRCLPLGAKEEKGTCIHCGKTASHRWIFGQSY